MKAQKINLILLCLLMSFAILSQNTLEITRTRFGKTRVFQVDQGEKIYLVTRSGRHYPQAKIVHMQDSMLMLEFDRVVLLTDIKKIRFNRRIEANVHMLSTLKGYFIFLGVAFISLNTLNNVILDRHPTINLPALAITGGFVLAGEAIGLLRTRKIKANNRTLIRVVERNYDHLSSEVSR